MPDQPITTTAQPGTQSSGYSALYYVFTQAIARMATSLPVKVVAVQAGGVGPVGYCDVQPLVDQIDASGNAVPHGVLHNLPYMRVQGGSSAIIIDPVVGDIGAAMFASHDISKVKATKAQALPGSRRRFSMSDAVYLGGALNGTPTQYIIMDATGIRIVSPTKITLSAPNVEIDAMNPVVITPDAIIGGKQYLPHKHSGVQTGSGVTGGVV